MPHATTRTLADCISTQLPVSIAASASVFEAACAMAQQRCGSILIYTQDRTLAGIFTERDLLNKVVALGRDPANTQVGDVMTANPRTAQAHMQVSHALVLMRDSGFRHLPVIDGENQVCGIFSIRDTLTSELADADRITSHHEHLSSVL